MRNKRLNKRWVRSIAAIASAAGLVIAASCSSSAPDQQEADSAPDTATTDDSGSTEDVTDGDADVTDDGSDTEGEGAQAQVGECTDLSFFSLDMTNPWLATMGEGAMEYAKDNGIGMKNYDAAGSLQTQIGQVQQAIADGTNGILITPVESDGIMPVINQAEDAGIPVIAVNANVSEGANIVTFVGVDHYDYGVGLAELALMAMPDGGNVALIQGVVGNPVEVLRTEAINDVLSQEDNVEIVTSVTDNWSNTENLAVVQDLLAKYGPGELQVVIAEGPEIYVGAQYAHSVGRDDVKFIAGDFPVQVRDGIVSGEIFGTVLQDGPVQGIAAIDAMCNWLTDNQDAVKRPSLMLELPLVTQDNVDQYDTDWDW